MVAPMNTGQAVLWPEKSGRHEGAF